MNGLVSIIIPCYNSMSYVKETIESALAQSYPYCEIIVVDDGSTDGSQKIIKSFGGKVKFIETLHKGACAARNAGWNNATGDWIQYLDSDDLLHQDKISLQIKQANKHASKVLISGSWVRFKGNISNQTSGLESLAVPDNAVDWLIAKYAGKATMAVHAWLTPRELIAKESGWDEQIHRNQDGEFFDRIVLRSEYIVHCPEAVAYYRSTPLSVSRQNSRRALASSLTVQQRGAALLLTKCNTSVATRAVAHAFTQIAIEAYPAFPDISREAICEVEKLGEKCEPKVAGGKIIKLAGKVFGWKIARHLQELARKFRNMAV